MTADRLAQVQAELRTKLDTMLANAGKPACIVCCEPVTANVTICAGCIERMGPSACRCCGADLDTGGHFRGCGNAGQYEDEPELREQTIMEVYAL